MGSLKAAIRKIRNFDVSYSIELFTVNPFYSEWEYFGPYSFSLEDSRGYGFAFFFIGIAIARNT